MKRNNKNSIIVLVLILLVGISIGYAALNSTLNINGRSNISKNTWNIHFDNVVTTNGSVEAVKIPTIENSTTVDFEVALNLPGDFYEFTVDVVNNGTIDAMIDSINKTPDLTVAQAKYLNYIIEYQNGEQITTKQLVKKDSFVRLKVRVEYKSDITASDLPTITETLNLGFTVNYVQSDGTGNEVTNNGEINSLRVVSGNYDTTGSEVCIGNECFYVIRNDGTNVSLIAKYNLHVGNKVTSCIVSEDDISCEYAPLDNPTGIQDSSAKGAVMDEETGELIFPWIGTIAFSDSIYWGTLTDIADVYNSNSLLYNHVENYKNYLESFGVDIVQARLFSLVDDEFIYELFPYEMPDWLFSTTYWTSFVDAEYNDIFVNSRFFDVSYNNVDFSIGLRPVIEIELPKVYFTINGTEYSVIEGTTWEQFVLSDANDLGLKVFDNYEIVCVKNNRNGCISLDGVDHNPVRYTTINSYDYTLLYYEE